MVVTTAVFWRTSPSGLAALSLMCGGDGLADIVGRRLGAGNKLWFNKNKSAAGSAAMFLARWSIRTTRARVFRFIRSIEERRLTVVMYAIHVVVRVRADIGGERRL